MPGIPKNPLVARAFSHNLTHERTRDLRIFRDIDGFSHKVSHQLKANLHQSTQLWLLQALPGLRGRESLVAAVWAWSGKHPACVWLLCAEFLWISIRVAGRSSSFSSPLCAILLCGSITDCSAADGHSGVSHLAWTVPSRSPGSTERGEASPGVERQGWRHLSPPVPPRPEHKRRQGGTAPGPGPGGCVDSAASAGTQRGQDPGLAAP